MGYVRLILIAGTISASTIYGGSTNGTHWGNHLILIPVVVSLGLYLRFEDFPYAAAGRATYALGEALLIVLIELDILKSDKVAQYSLDLVFAAAVLGLDVFYFIMMFIIRNKGVSNSNLINPEDSE